MLEYVEKNARTMSNDYDIWGKVTEVNKLVGKARSIELSAINLTPEQSHILRILMYNGGTSTINEIADISLRTHNKKRIIKTISDINYRKRKRVIQHYAYKLY